MRAQAWGSGTGCEGGASKGRRPRESRNRVEVERAGGVWYADVQDTCPACGRQDCLSLKSEGGTVWAYAASGWYPVCDADPLRTEQGARVFFGGLVPEGADCTCGS